MAGVFFIGIALSLSLSLVSPELVEPKEVRSWHHPVRDQLSGDVAPTGGSLSASKTIAPSKKSGAPATNEEKRERVDDVNHLYHKKCQEVIYKREPSKRCSKW